ncbi:MAG: response regulator [Tepidisphaeraceae bacterium]
MSTASTPPFSEGPGNGPPGPAASQSSLRDLADAMPQLAWIAGPTGAIEFFNRRWYEFTGVPSERTTATNWPEVLHPDDRETAKSTWQRCVDSGEPYEIEYRIRRGTDGQFRWHLGRGLPTRDSQGRVVRWFGTCTDIHERKTTELDLLNAKAKSDTAGRAKDEFLSIVSHELRTPLSAILGWTQLLEMDVLDENERREAVQTIKQQAKAQSQLIEDLLDVSRILNGKFTMRLGDMALTEIANAAIHLTRNAAAAAGVAIEKGDWNTSLIVHGDPHRLQQVISNLLNSSIKFSGKNSVIRVSVAATDGHAAVKIYDSVSCVPVDQIEAIFNCLRDGGEGIKEKGALGLGMTIVKHIVDTHKGSVSATAEDNGGKSLVVLLPTVAKLTPVDAMSVGTGGDPVTDAPLAGRRALVVDDEESARTVIATALRKSGCDVTTARDTADAWDLLGKQTFDFLVSDLGMPGHNGLHLIGKIRQPDVAFNRLPAIALTGFASVDDQTRALAAGFNVHVTKPVEPSELIRQIISLLPGR